MADDLHFQVWAAIYAWLERVYPDLDVHPDTGDHVSGVAVSSWRCTWCDSEWDGVNICPRCDDQRDVYARPDDDRPALDIQITQKRAGRGSAGRDDRPDQGGAADDGRRAV